MQITRILRGNFQLIDVTKTINKSKAKIVLNVSDRLCKVHIFWEGHKILQNLDLSYVVPVKSMVEILQNFMAFSEYMNLIYKTFFLFLKKKRSYARK